MSRIGYLSPGPVRRTMGTTSRCGMPASGQAAATSLMKGSQEQEAFMSV
jgi:hypothetical protein